jgi:hypothetical protein
MIAEGPKMSVRGLTVTAIGWGEGVTWSLWLMKRATARLRGTPGPSLRFFPEGGPVADDERVRRRAERHADERTITEHDRSQFLPSSLDADQVREALTAVTAAQTGWEYLRGTVPPRDLLALLDTPAIARLGSGVVVPTAAVDNAVACLEGGDIRTTSLVSVYTTMAADALIAAARAGPPPRTRPPGRRSAAGWWTRMRLPPPFAS